MCVASVGHITQPPKYVLSNDKAWACDIAWGRGWWYTRDGGEITKECSCLQCNNVIFPPKHVDVLFNLLGLWSN